MIETLANPNLAYVLLAAACLGFLVEAANPGMTVPGATGVAALVFAGLGLLHLPTTVAGLLLIAASAVLFGAEQFSAQPWAGPVAGMLVFMSGGLALFREPAGVNRWVLVLTAGALAVGAVTAARTARRVRMRRRPVRDPADFRGRVATVVRPHGTRGQVKIDGTWWTVQARDDLTAGAVVEVVDRRDLVLIVEPVKENPWKR